MTLMTDWRDSPSTFELKTKMALMPKMFLSSIPPSGPELLAVSTKEAADGWPAPVVARANSRRVGTKQFFFGTNGVSSVRPEPDILGPGRPLSWMSGFGVAVDLVLEGFVPMSEGYSRYVYGVVPKLPDPYTDVTTSPVWYTQLEIASGIARRLMDDESLVPISCSMRAVVSDGTNNGLSRTIGSHYQVMISELPVSDGDTFAVSFHVGPTRADQWASPVRVSYCTVIFARPASMAGIDGFVFAPVYQDSWAHNGTTHLDFKMRCIGGRGASGWDTLFSLVSPNCQFTRVPGGAGVDRGLGGTVMSLNKPLWSVTAFPEPSLPPLPFTSVLGPGPHAAGLYGATLYHIGDPEFVDSFCMNGVTTLSATEVAVESSEIFVSWSGDRLVDMDTGSMSDEDKVNMRGQIFKSHITSHPIRGPISIDDLAIASDIEDAGLEIKEEILVDAKDGNPAITFLEGETRVNSADRRIYHAMLGKFEYARMASTYVKATGVVNAWSLVTPSGGAEVPVEPADALILILQGATFIDNTGILLNGAFSHIFEMTYADAMAKRDTMHKQHHFDEKLTFKERRPDIRILSNAQQTALMLVQFTHNRAQMSSFVVGAMVMAANARKRLL